MTVDQLLPIGSVVLLRDGTKRIMIYGIRQADPEDPAKEYDYVAVLYPEGNLGDAYQFLFNHEEIARVDFKGMEDEERVKFIRSLSEIY